MAGNERARRPGATSRAAGVAPPEVVAAVLLLLVPFWGYLHFHRYSALRSESLAIAGALAGVGVLLGLTIQLVRVPMLRALLTAVLLFVSIDLFADISGWHLVLLAALLAGSWFLRTHIHRIAVAVLLAVLVTTVVAGAREDPAIQPARGIARQGQGRRPPLLHLIADEHVGVEGIPTDIPGGSEAKAALIDFYVQHGFRLFTRAYSRYHLTADAIPNALNFSSRDQGLAWLGPGAVTYPAPLKDNAYFNRLAKGGFDIRTYQPGFIDFCGTTGAAPVACFMVPANSVGNVPALSMEWGARTRLIAQHWVANNSSIYDRANTFYDERVRPALAVRHLPAPTWARTTYPLGPASGLRVLQAISQDVRELPDVRGTAFFGHVLLPHAPYMLEGDCRVSALLFSQASQRALRQLHVQAQRGALYQRYWPQLRCLTSRVGTLVAELEARGARDVVVIVHGDHGARIGAPIPPVGQPFTRADFDDFYSTLFAVRAPGIAAGVDSSVVSVPELLDRLSASDFSSITMSSDSAPFVYRTGDEDRPMRVRTPVPAR